MDRRKAGIFRLGRIDPGQRGVSGAEVYPDFHPDPTGRIGKRDIAAPTPSRSRLGRIRDIYATVSRTLNSSFQRRPSRATHHSCSMPVSVITVSNDTGTRSEAW